jgi:hypothetical protein
VAKLDSKELTRKILTPTAFPSIFPGLPSHYERPVPAQRSEATSSSSRWSRQAEEMEKAAEAFLAAGKVSTLQELRSKMDRDCIPSDFYLIDRGCNLLFIFIPKEGGQGPKVTAKSQCVRGLKL